MGKADESGMRPSKWSKFGLQRTLVGLRSPRTRRDSDTSHVHSYTRLFSLRGIRNWGHGLLWTRVESGFIVLGGSW
jgi:hypothetical protein